jgi:hypothetical protein
MNEKEVTPKYLWRSFWWMVGVIVGATLLAPIIVYTITQLVLWTLPANFGD